MTVTSVQGVDINYEIIGDAGPWVALITGGRRGYQELLPLAKKIAAQGFRILMHDRRNTGASGISLAAEEVEEAVWADDLFALLTQLKALPIFVGGSSSGARTALKYCLRHPEKLRGLLLLRVTGGEFSANRLPENYYGQFIRAAEEGGMAALCETDAYQERIAANPANRETLMNMKAQDYIDIMTRLRDLFVSGAHHPVMGVSDEELQSIKTPTIIIPGNDKTHSSASGNTAHRLIPESRIHNLPIEDQDVPVISFDQWSIHEAEITDVFSRFMKEIIAQDHDA
jgi:pimeloyl-ACP methyl ester carboxylesterase